MIKLKYPSYAGMPLSLFQAINNLDKTDPYYIVEVLSLLTGESRDTIASLTMREVQKLSSQLDFLLQEVPVRDIKLTKININDNIYKVITDLDKFTYSQFVDFDNYTKTTNILDVLPEILSLVILPKDAKEYNKDYDIEAVIKDIKSMDVCIALPLFFSLNQKLQKSLKNTLRSLYWKMKVLNLKYKNQEVTEKLTEIKQLMKTL